MEWNLDEGLPMLTALPTLDAPSCDQCGACCTYVGVPPGYGRFRHGDPTERSESDWETADGIRWRTLPDHVRRELTDYDDAVGAGLAVDRTDECMPCLWYDESTRRCRHYEWRPQVCRDYRAGSANCLAIRQVTGIDDAR